MSKEEFEKQIKDRFPDFSNEDINKIFQIIENLRDMQGWIDKFNIKC